MQPWYIATETFTPRHEGWATYIAWCGLTQLDEVVSLDPMLCPSLLPDVKTEYWPHIVNEDFMLNFFVDFEFLLGELTDGVERNLLCVFRNPASEPPLPASSLNFEILDTTWLTFKRAPARLPTAAGFPRSSRIRSCRRKVC